MSSKQIKQLSLAGVMAALVFVMTYVPKIPVPVTGGYVHLGDGMIFLSVMLLGPVGIAASAVGSALADLVGGYMTYLPATFLIKGAVALIAWAFTRKDSWLRSALAFTLAECAMVAGYFAFECLLYGAPAALGAVLPNVMQGLAGVMVGLLCRTLTPRLKSVIH